MRVAPWLALLVAACGRNEPQAVVAPQGGVALERAARARGLVADATTPVGVYRSDADRVCVSPDGDALRIGVSVDYGDGQRCVARGRATGRDRLAVDLGDGCRFDARVDADRIAFPALMPEACDRSCVGRASLTALAPPRLSAAPAEAARLRGADGRLLCGD